MAGLFGFYDPKQRRSSAEAKSILDTMGRSFVEPEWKTTTELRDGLALGLVYYRSEETPRVSASNHGHLVASSGSFIALEDEAATLWSRVQVNRRLLQLCDERPPHEAKLDGRVAIVHLDRARKTLNLGVDRFGLYPLYILAAGGNVWFSTRLEALYRVFRDELEYDTDAIADYVAHRHFIGNRTWFKNVEFAGEGTRYQFHDGTLRPVRYWSYQLVEDPDKQWSQARAVEALTEAWERAMDAVSAPATVNGVALSGGLDSRAITAALHHRGKEIRNYTFGDPNCNDIRFARAITDLYRIPHLTTTLDQASYIATEHDILVRRTDGAMPLNHGHLSVLRPYMVATADTFHDGLTGGVLATSKSFDHKSRVNEESGPEAIKQVFLLHPDDLVQQLVPGASSLQSRIQSNGYYYSSFGHSSTYDLIHIFSNTSRQRRFTAQNPRFLEGDRRTYTPFWTCDYYEVGRNLSPYDKKVVGPYVEMNRRLYPELKWIPWTKTALPLTVPNRLAHTAVKAADVLSYGNYYIKKFTGLAPLGSFQAGFAFYFDWMRENARLKSFILDVLTDPSVDRIPFLDGKAIAKAVDFHMTHFYANYADLIGTLLATVLYYRQIHD